MMKGVDVRNMKSEKVLESNSIAIFKSYLVRYLNKQGIQGPIAGK